MPAIERFISVPTTFMTSRPITQTGHHKQRDDKGAIGVTGPKRHGARMGRWGEEEDIDCPNCCQVVTLGVCNRCEDIGRTTVTIS